MIRFALKVAFPKIAQACAGIQGAYTKIKANNKNANNFKANDGSRSILPLRPLRQI
jgi:hypothetical protein